MPKQPAFPDLRHSMKKKQTRREKFLAEMNVVEPWMRLLAMIETQYSKRGARDGQPPMPLETMLWVYFLQQWYAFSDPTAAEMLYDRWDSCRPTQKASQCAKVVVFDATQTERMAT